MTWSSVRYTAKDIARHSLPVIARQRSVSSSQRQVTHSLTIRVHSLDNTTPLMHVSPRKQWFTVDNTSGYATMVHGRGCNPHSCKTTFANVESTSLWRHWWRHNSETIKDRQKRKPPRAMKSSELSNDENRIALRQLLQNRKLRHLWRHNLGSRRELQKKWLERILALARSTI